MKFLTKLKNSVLDAVFPPYCPFCGRLILSDESACQDCASKLVKTPIKKYTIGGYVCSAAFPYRDMYAEAVKQFKFGGKSQMANQLAVFLAKAVTEVLSAEEFESIDVITFVPMFWDDKYERGFNQSESLAKKCAEIFDLKCAELLVKPKRNKTQHLLKSGERESNVKGAFKLSEKAETEGKHVLLIDDIITTGHTLGECAKILKKGGCRKVSCAVVCASVF